MSNISANVHNLNDSRIQALQALQSVSERLGEILGEAAVLPEDGTHRNESGELVNEEGLPIIDITEPVDELDTPSLSAATEEDEVIEEDNYPEPISKLSREALAISRKHRDKILELLEEEEEREERRTRREHQLELEQKREAARLEMQKRMISQGSDLEKRRRAKEMEKKMAKALVNGVTEPEPVDSKTSDLSSQDKKKKVVTFADPLPEDSKTPSKTKPQGGVNWGDVVPGRLPAKLDRLSSSRTQPMRMEVVERPTTLPSSDSVSTSPPPESIEHSEPIGDSDDESDSEEASDSTVALDSEDEDVVLSAQRHRELALEYHRRREALASNAGALHLQDASIIGNIGNESLDWDKEEVPLEATLTHPPPKPSISKFKASVLNGTDRPAITSVLQPSGLPSSSPGPTDPCPSATFGTPVLPPDALAKSVKLGKLVDGNLFAGPEDEEEIDQEAREEEEIRKLLLKSMEDYSGIAAQVMGPAAAGSYWAKPEADATTSASNKAQPVVMPKPKPKVSRFKVNRTQTRASTEPGASSSTAHPISTTSTTHPRSGTPVSGAGRSSPKLPSHDQGQTSMGSSTSPSIVSPMTVIDSPSFAPPAPFPCNLPPNNVPPRGLPVASPHGAADSLSPHPTIIDSPSFMAPSSMVIESPSFRRPVGSQGPQAVPARKSPTVIPTPSTRPPERESFVMANDVTERSGDRRPSVNSGSEVKSRRVSRFKAERSAD